MMGPFRCQLCGETYLGSDKPDRCPYCGANPRELLEPTYWVENPPSVDLSSKDREFIEKAQQLELNNAAFYRQCAQQAETVVTQSIFKRLGKQELEHAELLGDLAGMEDLPLPEVTVPDDDAEKFAEAGRREKRAIKFYLEVASQAHSPRLREVMRALSDIESEHLKVSNVYR